MEGGVNLDVAPWLETNVGALNAYSTCVMINLNDIVVPCQKRTRSVSVCVSVCSVHNVHIIIHKSEPFAD